MKMQRNAKEQFASVYKDNTWDELTSRKAPYLMIFYKTMQLIVHQLNELKTTFIVGQSRKIEGTTAILKAVDKVDNNTNITINMTAIAGLAEKIKVGEIKKNV